MTSLPRSTAYGTRSQRGDGVARLKRTWFEITGRRSADSSARQRPRPWLLTPTWRAMPSSRMRRRPVAWVRIGTIGFGQWSW